jgi:hypothetical protein
MLSFSQQDRHRNLEQTIFEKGEPKMGDKGKKDKDKREEQKKAKHSLEEKRKLLEKGNKNKETPSAAR